MEVDNEIVVVIPKGNECNFFEELPREVKCLVFSFTDGISLLKARRVCKRWAADITDDSIWKSVVEHEFGITKVDNDDASSWYELFKNIAKGWSCWDPVNHYPAISIDTRLRISKTPNECAETYYLPIRGKLGVKKGRHYFEVKILDNRSSSLFCAIGVGSAAFPTNKAVSSGYTHGNNGVGWYSHGHIYHFGQGVVMDSSKGFAIGDRVGFLLDMDQGLITFFKNGVSFHDPLTIASPENEGAELELFPIFLSERGLTAEIQLDTKLPSRSLAKFEEMLDTSMDENINHLMTLGFELHEVKKALIRAKNDVIKAANFLIGE